MREILFRAKAKNKKCWVYGDLIHCENGYGIIEKKGGCIKVKPETIGQYTGLKDKNGTKIFEGDIVKQNIGITLNNKPRYIYYCINYCEDDRCLRAFKNGTKGYAYSINFARYVINDNNLEVIGNVFDNPELLEKVGE